MLLLEICDSFEVSFFIQIIKKFFLLIQIITPILLIVSLTITFIKMLSNPDNKQNKAKLKNKVIACIIIFSLPTIINITIQLFSNSTYFTTCWNSNNSISLKSNYIENPKKKKQNLLINPDDYKNGTQPTNSNSNSKQDDTFSQVKSKQFLNILNKYSKTIENDAKNNNNWTYGYNKTKYTFHETASSTKYATCVMIPVWGLTEMGLIEEGDQINKTGTGTKSKISFFKRGNKSQNRAVKERWEKALDFYDGNFQKASTLIQEGKIQTGDIIFWGSLEHVSIYAGNQKWYDAGRVGVNGSGSYTNYKFNTLGPLNIPSAMNATVYKIARIK